MSEDMKIADDMIAELEKKFNAMKDSKAGLSKAVGIVFPDIETGYIIKFALDGSVEKVAKKPASEVKPDDADVTVSVDVPNLRTVLNGILSPNDAANMGIFRIEGDRVCLTRLLSAMEK
jgi:alkyl sulfatase BDS1-like metallo-beta-lactamase superfamily hydrolase